MEGIKKLKQIGVIPVVQLEEVNDAVPMAAALRRGGLPCAEITFRTAAAAEVIRQIHAADPTFLLAAGTVLTAKQADEAISAGADLLVSPGLDLALTAHCAAHGYPMVPGVCTPSEIQAAMKAGLTWLKFFPAKAAGGIAMLQALHGPFRNVHFMPTGGVTQQDLAAYLRCPGVDTCGGSWIVPGDALAGKDFSRIEALAREAVQIVKGVRINSRRHQAFMINKKICPPSIRHQLLNIPDVVCDAPIAKATGAVNTSTPSRM